MPEEAEPDNLDELQQDDLIERLVNDPARLPDLIVLVGFLGRSAQEGYWRLYCTAALDAYIEFRAEDFVRRQPLSTEQSSVGGTVIWLRRDAMVKYTRVESYQVQAEFLQGDIMANLVARGIDIPPVIDVGKSPDVKLRATGWPLVCPRGSGIRCDCFSI